MDKKWWLLYCWVWKKNKECEERVLLIVVVVIDCGVSTTVNTTMLLIYNVKYYMCYWLFVKNWADSPIVKCTSYDTGIYLKKIPWP